MPATITATQESLQVRGDINFGSVANLRVDGDVLIIRVPDKSLLVDLANVTRCDSSGLSLMTAWQRCAKHHGKTITFTNVPRSLLQLAELCGLTDLLALTLKENRNG